MNTTAIRLVFVETNTVFDVMCKILTVVVAFFECACVNSTFLGRDSLPLVLIYIVHVYFIGHCCLRKKSVLNDAVSL